MKVNFWRSQVLKSWMIMNGWSLPRGFWIAGPKLLAKKKGSLKFGANGPSFASFGQQQRSTRSQFDRWRARPVFNRVVKAKVAVLRFWSDSSGSMSQLHLAVPWGRNFSRCFSVGGCCGFVFLLVVSRWVSVVNVTSKLRDQVRSQLESTGNGRFWLEGSFWIFERFHQKKIDTHTLSYTHAKRKEVRFVYPPNIRLSKCFCWENPIIRIWYVQKSIQINSVWS